MTLKTSRTEGIANIQFKVAPCDRFHYMSHKHRAVAEEWNVQDDNGNWPSIGLINCTTTIQLSRLRVLVKCEEMLNETGN